MEKEVIFTAQLHALQLQAEEGSLEKRKKTERTG